MIRQFTGYYRFLSNFSYDSVVYNGLSYKTAEHAYQAAKCTKDKDREAIRQLLTPGKAKKQGRLVELRDDWESVKDGVMEDIVRAKFFQNPEIAKKLVNTGDHELVEGNWWGDEYWGVCDGYGLNKLGEILMKVRDELR